MGLHVGMTVPQSRRFAVNIGGYEVTLPPAQHRFVEIMLLLRGTPHPMRDLVEIMWPDPDEQPLDAKGVIRQYLHKLRKLGVHIERHDFRGYFLPDNT